MKEPYTSTGAEVREQDTERPRDGQSAHRSDAAFMHDFALLSIEERMRVVLGLERRARVFGGAVPDLATVPMQRALHARRCVRSGLGGAGERRLLLAALYAVMDRIALHVDVPEPDPNLPALQEALDTLTAVELDIEGLESRDVGREANPTKKER